LLRFLADNGPRRRNLTPEELRLVRAAVVLARSGTPAATEGLRSLAADHALRSAIEEADPTEQLLTHEARAALEGLRGQLIPDQSAAARTRCRNIRLRAESSGAFPNPLLLASISRFRWKGLMGHDL